MTLELDDDQALVLFEWLSRHDDARTFPCEDPAEELALWALHGQLESRLVAQFHPDYRALVASARARLRDRDGGPPTPAT